MYWYQRCTFYQLVLDALLATLHNSLRILCCCDDSELTYIERSAKHTGSSSLTTTDLVRTLMSAIECAGCCLHFLLQVRVHACGVVPERLLALCVECSMAAYKVMKSLDVLLCILMYCYKLMISIAIRK
jgi:hypothetical protein